MLAEDVALRADLGIGGRMSCRASKGVNPWSQRRLSPAREEDLNNHKEHMIT